MTPFHSTKFILTLIVATLIAGAACFHASETAGEGPGLAKDLADAYAQRVQPLLKKYCHECHSAKARKGDLDLERFTSLTAIRKDVKPWLHFIEQLDTGEMPPKNKPQPSTDERKLLIAWVRDMLAAEARARSGDPGRVPLRRLSNSEYDTTIRDLTGVDLQPAREFPADGAGGEGFTNAAESLSDVTPALFSRYLKSAKEIAEHAVLLPDGFRFSPAKRRRDWTDESIAKLRKFYASYVAADGRLAPQPYLAAAVKHRDALLAGKSTVAEIALKEKLNAKYLAALWQALTDKTPSQPLDTIRARWKSATDKDVPGLAAEVASWQTALWKTYKIGSYIKNDGKGYSESVTRQVANDPAASDTAILRAAVKPMPGQNEVTITLSAKELFPGSAGHVVWHRPRFEGVGKSPLLLRDYPQHAAAFELDYPTAFTTTAKYLAATAESAGDKKAAVETLATKHGLDSAFLKRWIEVLALEPRKKDEVVKTVAAITLTPLSEKTPKDGQRPAISGWKKKGSDLPVLVTNASDTTLQIPGRVSARGVAVHPLPKEFVAVTWKSPVSSNVNIAIRIAHAHPACGNGVAWWLEHRRSGQANRLGEGVLNLGQEEKATRDDLKVEKGDLLVLAVDARDGNHICDMTEIAITITEAANPKRTWNLAADIANDVQAGNPHADKHGNADTWSFGYGPSKGGTIAGKPAPIIPLDSVLGRWRLAAVDPARIAEATQLANQTQALLSGSRPAKVSTADGVLYDKFVAGDGPLFNGLDLAKLAKPHAKATDFGLPRQRFGVHPAGKTVDEASIVADANSVTEVRLPAALFKGRDFVVDARLDDAKSDRVIQVRVTSSAPDKALPPSSVLASTGGAGYRKLVQGHADFRQVFPLFLCFPQVVPTDEVVSLKMFHREDDPLLRMFLDEDAVLKLNHLWSEHRFISHQAILEHEYLPQFIGFVTQDQPKAMEIFFLGQQPAFKKRADDFAKDEATAVAPQLDALLAFAGRAYRRPLSEKDNTELRQLYQTIRKKGASHDEAFRGVLTRVLAAPAFLFRIEKASAGVKAGNVDDSELASRLSYFLWSSMPDEDLRRLADASKLRDPKVLTEQTQRMLKDARVRSLAIEFGTQWIHVRAFDKLKEKNEKLFPTFDAKLRQAIYEESILFFQDLFQNDQPVTRILDADYTFLNETLAKHYGIAGITGLQWRKVEGVRKYGRGGILGLAAVHAKQSGASRTSPVLRGNWVVETLLGEKLPRPPADVPILPDEEGSDKRTTRQMVERHVSDKSCAACHVRIDPFGFAFENFDPIGRWRVKESTGLPVDTKAKLKDGTEFDGIDGLRSHLLTKKKDVITRLFSQRLLGYALGRATTLSDGPLIDEMTAELNKNEGRTTAAVLAIVRSPQFRMIRGSDTIDD